MRDRQTQTETDRDRDREKMLHMYTCTHTLLFLKLIGCSFEREQYQLEYHKQQHMKTILNANERNEKR